MLLHAVRLKEDLSLEVVRPPADDDEEATHISVGKVHVIHGISSGNTLKVPVELTEQRIEYR